jgi:hypothetical protein
MSTMVAKKVSCTWSSAVQPACSSALSDSKQNPFFPR